MNTRLDAVLEFATNAHKGQFRKNKTLTGEKLEYITHPIHVADLAEKEFYYWKFEYDSLRTVTQEQKDSVKDIVELIKATAFLHDVIEDTKYREEDLQEMLDKAGYDIVENNKIRTAVFKLTRVSKNTDIIRYLDDILGSHIAIFVKFADLKHNMSDLEPGNLYDKYRLCEAYLLKHLDTASIKDL